MSLILFWVLYVLTILVIGSIVPIINFIKIYKSRDEKRYFFSKELFGWDTQNIKFEKTIDKKNHIGRMGLANRGWVRCLNGKIFDNDDFEIKKKEEYNIPLP